jgi:hypothetical protein
VVVKPADFESEPAILTERMKMRFLVIVEGVEELAELLASMRMAGLGTSKVYPPVDLNLALKLVDAKLEALPK